MEIELKEQKIELKKNFKFRHGSLDANQFYGY